MDSVIELLVYPNFGLIAAALVLFVAVMSTTTPNKMFKYHSGAVHAELNSGRWATVVFFSIIFVVVQSVVLYYLSGSDYMPFSGVHTTQAVPLLGNVMPTLKVIAAVYASGFVLMPVAWSMFNSSYIESVKHLLRATTGHSDFEKAVIMDLREKLIEFYSSANIVSSDNSKTNKPFVEYKAELFANKKIAKQQTDVKGPKGENGDLTLDIDTIYLNANSGSVDIPGLSFSAVDHVCEGKISSINQLFQIVLVQYSNPYYGDANSGESKYLDNALFLINGAKIRPGDLRKASLDRINELRNQNLITPISSRILDTEISRAMLSDLYNLINEAKREIALSPSTLAGQLAIVTFNWPVYVTAMCTSGLRRSAKFFVLYFKNVLKVMSEDALKKL